MLQVNRLLFVINFLFILIALAMLYVAFGDAQRELIVRIDTLRKVITLGTRGLVARFTVVGCALVTANLIGSRWAEARSSLTARLFAAGSLVVAALILVAVAGIIAIN